jgi:hypothetical protein
VGGYGGSPREGGVFDRKSLSGRWDRKNLSIGDPYRVKKYWKKLLKMVKNAWESKLGVVYLHWRGLWGGGGEKIRGGGEGYPIKTSYKKLGYPISLSYIYLLSPYKGQRNFKTDLFT